ncbi:MAG: 2TM domain-containing protein [Flavobacteriaceae bacterium]
MNKIPSDEEIRYEIASKKVKKLKGFYSHLIIYIVINTIILIANYQFWNKSGNFFSWNNLSTAFFWGIGLVAHGFSVFGANIFLGKDWEEKKIKELMNKDKKRNQNWE